MEEFNEYERIFVTVNDIKYVIELLDDYEGDREDEEQAILYALEKLTEYYKFIHYSEITKAE